MTDAWDDEQPTADQQKRQRELAERDAEDIRQVMSTESGRRVIWSVLEQGKVFAATFSVDPCVTAFNEGQRNLALALFSRVMTVCPEQYLKMADEAKNRSEQ